MLFTSIALAIASIYHSRQRQKRMRLQFERILRRMAHRTRLADAHNRQAIASAGEIGPLVALVRDGTELQKQAAFMALVLLDGTTEA
jgi:type II secretory pathway component PulJ